jgi:hypothetical protein
MLFGIERTVLAIAAITCLSLSSSAQSPSQPIRITSGNLTFIVQAHNFRYGFQVDGQQVVSPDADAGLLLAGSPVSIVSTNHCTPVHCTLSAQTPAGDRIQIIIKLSAHHAELIARPEHVGEEVRFQTAGASPAYGLADHAIEQKQFSTLTSKQFNTDVTGFRDDAFLSGQGITRLVSNFIIYPQQGFAELLIDPNTKIVHTSRTQIVQGVVQAAASVPMHYFFGNPHQIYAAYRAARIAAGYPVLMPKYDAFGVGWEAFGALGWDTNQQTVRESVDRYLTAGYPLRWIVIGSGFWPSPAPMHETTSFGLWDKQKYPDPAVLLQHFHDEGLKNMLGLRITFITNGPFAAQGLAGHYFLTKDGAPEIFKGGWPKLPYYLLDAHNPRALNWYMNLVARWENYGVDGFKEDFYGYGGYNLRDDKVDPTNNRLMAQGKLVIERNGYLSSNGDLHRINDFNYDQDQDRGPVNALALAYSGFPLVYPDIVGGTFGENHFSRTRTPQMETYMERNVQWAALHSSMGMGEPPWTFSPAVAAIMLQSAKLHARFVPYIYSNARHFAEDGYPWTMTPLPIAFPHDPLAYGRENATSRAYEWLIGDALLATPLYGNDYATATTRDIYLPKGRWMDFDTGTIYTGGRILKSFALPPGKTPLFVGGSGVTLENIANALHICIYPTAASGDTALALPSGRTLTIKVRMPSGSTAWSTMHVTSSQGKTIPVIQSGHALTFIPGAADSYTITLLQKQGLAPGHDAPLEHEHSDR